MTAAALTPDQPKGDISALIVWAACAIFYVTLMTITIFGDAASLQGELGVMETVQNLFLLTALVLAIRNAVVADTRLLRWWMIVVSLGTFYLLTEETSWGQHYFGWEIGGIFENLNDQGETNFHNSSSWLDQKPRAILLFGMILGTIVHPLVKLARNGRGLFDNPWWLAPTLVSLPPVIFSQLGALPERIDDTNMLDISLQALTAYYRSSEMEELFMYFFFVTYTLSLAYRYDQRRRSGVRPVG